MIETSHRPCLGAVPAVLVVHDDPPGRSPGGRMVRPSPCEPAAPWRQPLASSTEEVLLAYVVEAYKDSAEAGHEVCV